MHRTQAHKEVRRRGARELPPDLAQTGLSGRKNRPKHPEVPVIGAKPIVDVPSPPATVPSVEEITVFIAQHKLVDAARGLNALLARCASDVPDQVALSFIEAAVPLLRPPSGSLRGSARNEVKAVMNRCIQRLVSTLPPKEKASLRALLVRFQMNGTIDAYFDQKKQD